MDETDLQNGQKSRTQKKKEMKDLQKLGETLVALPPALISKMEMPEDVREAVLFCKTVKKHEARRRQIKRIGALLREADADSVRADLEKISRGRTLALQTFALIERWRDDIVGGSNEPIRQIVERFPEADQSRLVQLAQDARREKERGKPPKSSRSLFRYIRELVEKAE